MKKILNLESSHLERWGCLFKINEDYAIVSQKKKSITGSYELKVILAKVKNSMPLHIAAIYLMQFVSFEIFYLKTLIWLDPLCKILDRF